MVLQLDVLILKPFMISSKFHCLFDSLIIWHISAAFARFVSELFKFFLSKYVDKIHS